MSNRSPALLRIEGNVYQRTFDCLRDVVPVRSCHRKLNPFPMVIFHPPEGHLRVHPLPETDVVESLLLQDIVVDRSSDRAFETKYTIIRCQSSENLVTEERTH